MFCIKLCCDYFLKTLFLWQLFFNAIYLLCVVLYTGPFPDLKAVSWFPLFLSSESSIAFVKFKDVLVLRIFREMNNLFFIHSCDLVHRKGAQSKGWACVWKQISGITLFWLVSECIGKCSFSVFPWVMLLSILLVTLDIVIKILSECKILLIFIIKIIKWKAVHKALLNT